MDGVHDMGGMHGFGKVVTPDGELTHHESWEVRGQVLGFLSGSVARAWIEALDPAEYLAASYYWRWFRAAETTLLERTKQLEASDIDRWLATFAADPDARPPVASAPEVVEMIRNIGPHSHQPAPDAAYVAGDRVRVRRMRPESHHRCPRYVRGAIGVVEKVLGADPLPGMPDDPHPLEPCYTVQFSSVDLFGDHTDAGEPPYMLLIDLWESYLEPVA